MGASSFKGSTFVFFFLSSISPTIIRIAYTAIANLRLPLPLPSKLHIFGGSPLNSEVWRLNRVTKVPRREPNTRSFYNDMTYDMEWESLGDAPWSNRVGMSVVRPSCPALLR